MKTNMKVKALIFFALIVAAIIVILCIYLTKQQDIYHIDTDKADETVIYQDEIQQNTKSDADYDKSGSYEPVYFNYEDKAEHNENLSHQFNLLYKFLKNMNNPKEASKVQLKPTNKDLIYIATDIHYYSPLMTDYGQAFWKMLDRDDGKDIKDSDAIVDDWIDLLIDKRPATVILSGDITLNGESIGHMELAKKLDRLLSEGIQVLVIPGNHDINCKNAAFYYNNMVEQATSPNADEFVKIYHQFGYDQASYRDDNSLSYVYKIDNEHWIMMIDTSIYDPENKVEGEIKIETLSWMDSVFNEAQKEGAEVIPVSHHNLLSESRLYTRQCTLLNNQDIIRIVQKYNIKLWLSGHLHLQRIKKYLQEPGSSETSDNITEIVTAPLSMYPFSYGVIQLKGNKGLSYNVEELNADKDTEIEGKEAFENVIEKQIEDNIRGLPDDDKMNMADFYADLLQKYVSGNCVNATESKSEKGYQLFLKYMPDSEQMHNIDSMLADTKQDNYVWNAD